MVKALAITALLTALPWLAFADFSGVVVGITDGDTISVMHDGKAEKIRLNGIDCPENGQAFSELAKQLMSELAFDKIVLVKEFGKDRHGRTIGDVVLNEDVILNHQLVGAGLCWWYRKYAPTNAMLEHLETEAREAKRGLWADAEPVPPWKWRHRQEPVRR